MSLDETLAALADRAGLDDDTRSLLWAAYHGDDDLQRALSGERIEPPAASTSAGTVPVWLSSMAVEGFRGIGPRTELLLSPQPGLTLVVGRNGSGKSSFAEGLEALLTGDNLRWRDRPAAWQTGWKNLHHTATSEVYGEFQREGDAATINLTRRFGDSFDDATVTGEQDGAPIDVDQLGWAEPLTNYKPFLSYNELGSMLEQKPSAIYDSMAGVLGLDRLTDARDRLRQARLDAEKPAKDVAKAKKTLLAALVDSDAAPAADAAALLKARTVDLDRLEALAFGDDTGPLEPLAAIAQLAPLDTERLATLRQSFADAITEHQRLATTDAATSDRLAALLRQAIDHRLHEGDGLCPVCGVGTIDQAWQDQAEQRAAQLERSAAAIQAAQRQLTALRRDAHTALVQPPAALSAEIGIDTTIDLVTNLRAVDHRWREWITPPEGGWTDDALLDRLDDVGDINAVIDGIRADAAAALAARDASWRPLAQPLAAWVVASRTADASTATAKRLGTAEEFYKDAEATMRAERFQPIADRAAQLWEGLRQQSNVNLERVSLEGRTTQRRVDLDVTVDGTATSALGVMSQGELHALALALFLPRVTASESPFRFLVVDDPVQAMDPARVDGLARVLASVATERQVIVFTHDDRLPAACRRLALDADIVAISRQSESRVSATPAQGPAERAIDDARILAKTERLPASLKQQIVPIHCRRALEAQAQDLAWRRLLGDGRSHAEVDQQIADADTTADILALFLFGENRPPQDVYDRLDAVRPGSAGQLKFLNRAVHEAPSDLNPEALAGTIRSLMRELRDLPVPP